MTQRRFTGIGSVAAGLALLLTAFAVAPAAGAELAPDPSRMDDVQFLDSLRGAAAPDEVDRGRLAKLFFSSAATLDGGRSSVQLLRGRLYLRGSDAEYIRGLVADRFRAYGDAVDRFRDSASRLLDDPGSELRLYETTTDGHRACSELGSYSRLVETYGVGSSAMMTVLSSTEACQRFRRASLQPAVAQIVSRRLERAESDARASRALRDEIAELERLLDDLREIDRSP